MIELAEPAYELEDSRMRRQIVERATRSCKMNLDVDMSLDSRSTMGKIFRENVKYSPVKC